jgi:hypothetical protein
MAAMSKPTSNQLVLLQGLLQKGYCCCNRRLATSHLADSKASTGVGIETGVNWNEVGS